MKVEKFRYEGIRPDGTFSDGRAGSIETRGGIAMSKDKGGCNQDGCNCSGGHWITVTTSRTEQGVVEGISLEFDNSSEMQKFFDTGELRLPKGFVGMSSNTMC